LESLGLRPGKQWALLASLSEFGGGVLTVLGFLNPIGPLATIGAMSMATAKAHWGKPIWNTSGGAELPVLNIAAALAMALVGPGAISLDHALGIRLPRRLVLVPGLVLVAAGVAVGVIVSAQPQEAAEEAHPQPWTDDQPQAARVPAQPDTQEQAHLDTPAAAAPDHVAGAEWQSEQRATQPL
jgi:putative oxidoreductase